MVNNYFLHKNPRKGNNFFAYMQIKVRILIEIIIRLLRMKINLN